MPRPPASQCPECGDAVGVAAVLTCVNESTVRLLPSDPIHVWQAEEHHVLHRQCAEAWVSALVGDDRELRVGFVVSANSVGEGGRRTYIPPDAVVQVRRSRGGSTYQDPHQSFRNALSGESDRGCVLVAAERINYWLELLLFWHFVRLSNRKTAKSLSRRTLRSLAARTEAAYGLGLLTTEEQRQIGVIRGIRNTFAHEWSDLDFDVESVCEELAKLPEHPVLFSSSPNERRRKFETVATVLMSNLEARADEARARMLEGKRAATPSQYFPLGKDGVMVVSAVELGYEVDDEWLDSLDSSRHTDDD